MLHHAGCLFLGLNAAPAPCRFADIRTRLIGDPPAAHAPGRPAPAAARAPGEEDEEALDVQVTGIGQPLVPGTAVKGTFEVVFVRRGGEAVTLERSPFSGTIGHGLWPPAVEVRMYMRSGGFGMPHCECAVRLSPAINADTLALSLLSSARRLQWQSVRRLFVLLRRCARTYTCRTR